MVVRQPSKLVTWVRFPSPAPIARFAQDVPKIPRDTCGLRKMHEISGLQSPRSISSCHERSCLRPQPFDIADREEYLAYSRRSVEEVAKHGGRVVALGRLLDSVAGDVEGRQVMILVEWSSREAFDGYVSDPALADLHRHRERGTARYVWQLFDRLDDLRPLLKK